MRSLQRRGRAGGKTSAVTDTHADVNVLKSRRPDERAQLVQWRREYLRRAGLDADLAARVAGDLRWDLHALMQLLERGCPPPLAARILQPLDEEPDQ